MRFRSIIGWLPAALLALGACTVKDDGQAPGEAVQPQSLALGVGAGTPTTKANPTFIPEMLSSNANPSFRGLSNIRVIPFFTGMGVKVRPTDQANGFSRLFPDIAGSATDAQVFNGHHFHDGLLEGSHAHYFSGGNALFTGGTTAMLVYARATEPELPEELLDQRIHKQRYGSLIEKGWAGENNSYPTPADIGFTPERIYGSDITAVASQMASLLTEVASTSVSIPYVYHTFSDQDWADGYASAVWTDGNLDCPELRQAFQDFVSIASEEHRLIPGAYVNLLWRLNSLKTFLDNFTCEDETVIMHGEKEAYLSYTEKLKKGYVNNALRDQLKVKVQTCKDALASYSQYPQAYGIPSGASFLFWDGAAFQALPEALDGWIPATRYCYMPALYYYANSTLSTSYSSDIYEQYPGKTWEQIVALYTAGKMVTKTTSAVALDTPLQFACGMLVATVQATVNPLRDRGEANAFTLDESSHDFPVTGLVLGGQYEQHYNFTPVTDDAAEEVQQETFLFDANISGSYVNTAQSAPFRTLVLPTPLEREVYFYLELRNDSGQSFQGADGIIPAGSRFYLAGIIPAPSQEDIAGGVNRVFMQDRFTQITCKITSLQNAYLCIPQMGNPELELGVQTKANWFFSPSTYVVLG